MHKLICFNVSHNNLGGPYPVFLSDIYPPLEYADLSFNQFTGDLPSLSNFNDPEKGLKFLILDDNLFSGSLSSSIFTNVSNTLERFSAKNNKLEGTFPHLNLPKLEALDLSNNRLTSSQFVVSGLPALQRLNISGNPDIRGNFSSDLCSLIKLSSIDLSSIRLKGTIPSCIGNLLDLQELILTHNYLSGTLPSELSKLTNLQQLMLMDNYLAGALPSSLGQLHGLTFLSIQGNLFGSTIPQELGGLKSIDFLDLSDNYFEYGSGLEFINNTNMPNLSYFDCSQNILAGSVPRSLWNISTLETVVMTSNCMEGSLPDAICLASSLKNLILDGLSVGDDTYNLCSATIWSTFYRETFHFDALRGQKMQGSIPFCVFSLPSLEKLHLSGNQFSGSIDPELKSWPSNLTELVLANNRLVGTISGHLQEQFDQLERLDLRRNKFNGTLVDSLRLPQLEVDLSVNRFSGPLPSAILEKSPTLKSFRLLEGNAFSCDLERSDLPTSDPAYSYYKCGSDLTNAVIYVAVSLLVVLLPYTYFHNKEAVSKQDTIDYSQLEKIKLFVKKADDLMYALAILGLVFVFVLIPVYATATVLYSSRSFSYIWSVSGAFKTGVPAATLLLFCFSGVTITAFGLLFRYQSFPGQVKTLSKKWEQVSDNFSAHQQKSNDDNRCNSSPRPLDEKFKWKVSAVLVVRLFVTFFVTFVLCVAVNVSYVQSVPTLSSTQLIFAQIAMAFFKFGWTYIAGHFLKHKISYFGCDSVKQKIDDVAKTNTFVSVLKDSYVTYVVLEIFIRIIIPCAASAYADSNCFKDYFHKQAPVYSSYGDTMEFSSQSVTPMVSVDVIKSGVIDRSPLVSGNFDLSLVRNSWNYEVPVNSSVSFIPPFQYMYVCSSRILEVYAPVVATSVVIRFLYFLFYGVALFVLDHHFRHGSHDPNACFYWLLLKFISRTDWKKRERRVNIDHYIAHLKSKEETEEGNLAWRLSSAYKENYEKHLNEESEQAGVRKTAGTSEWETYGNVDTDTEHEKASLDFE
jgi:Leucine-rich repeat (LRR) protein